VDLASQPAKTAAVAIDWGTRRIVAELGADDDAIRELVGDDPVGIDAPFGWPDAFVAMMRGAPPEPWSDDYRDRLRFRETDHVARELVGRWPLSVSSDLIGVVAFRCRGLKEGLDAFEVYPALALHRWGLTSRGYKGKDGEERRRAILRSLLARVALKPTRAQKSALVKSDHLLDALVAALVARAHATGRTEPIPDLEVAAREGWIVIPRKDALDALA